MRLYLIGYMGTGKSTIGRKVAKRCELPFLDTDKMVEEAEGATIADIVTYAGEEYFRRAERAALERSGAEPAAIISTGGGLPVWGDNMEWIAEAGYSVYLMRAPEQIITRLSPYGRAKRPMIRGKSDEELLAFMHSHLREREPVYMRATTTIDCSKYSDEEIVEMIVAMVQGNGELK